MTTMAQPIPAAIGERWATVAGHRMRYLHGGFGPPLLLVHGLLGYSFSWRFNLEPLVAQATVYAVDMLGVGYSDRVPGMDCGLVATARRLAEFMDAVGLESADVLGTSHGGAVVMMLAAEARPRVRRLILVAPANPWSGYGRRLAPQLSSRPGRWIIPRLTPLLPPVHRYMLARLYGDRSRIRPGTLEGYSAPIRTPGTMEHVLRILACWTSDLDSLARRLPELADLPTLLLWGDRDRAVYPESAPRLRSHFRHARLLVLPGVGHLPYEEAPEEFNAEVLRFLAGQQLAIGT